MNTPTPPEGYMLVKGEDIKDRVPEGALIWSSSQCLDDEPEWILSGRIGMSLYAPGQKTAFYAIPETKPAPAIPEVGPQPPDGYVLRHRSEIESDLPPSLMVWYPVLKTWVRNVFARLVDHSNDREWFAIKAVTFDPEFWKGDFTIEGSGISINFENNPLSQQEGGDHYKSLAIQPVEFIQANKLSFLEGCVVKRVCRHRAKNKAEDIHKAIHELRLILKLEYGEES